ncbi:MAG TPA: SMP-30/gluconolactonase/LRE family protein [Gemmatimonadaceae bacterium]|nr:SMP-30/gluconolactonase/LRE family protein [Gemmatimonadaceae bacterium]
MRAAPARLPRLLAVLPLACSAACAGARSSGDTPPAALSLVPAGADRLFAVGGFEIPESVRHDPRRDRYFVSNVGRGETAKDNNGYISRLLPDGTVEARRFIAGGERGVVLHAPKGLYVSGDTLWATDIDAVRAFDARTGAPLASVDLSPLGARFLNDVAAGPDGSLYVSDSGLEFHPDGRVTHPGPDRVFRVRPDLRPEVAFDADSVRVPNGVAWDPAGGGRLIVASFSGSRPGLYAWRPGAAARAEQIAAGPGEYDGVEAIGGGRLIVSSQRDSAVHLVDRGVFTRLAGGLPNVGDIGLDRTRNRLLVPLLEAGRVEVWQLR